MASERETSVVIGLLASCAGVALGAAAAHRAVDLLAASRRDPVQAASFPGMLGSRTPTEALELVVQLPLLLAGTAVGLWYAISALVTLACAALAMNGRRWQRGELAVQRWGAPALRRACTVAVGLLLGAAVGTATAGATGSVGVPDDLRWGAEVSSGTVPDVDEEPRVAVSVASPPVSATIGDPPGAGRERQEAHVVEPGESLWSIAAEALRQRDAALSVESVAAEWPRWYAANRLVVGSDPDLIRPGQVLQAPTDGELR